MKKFALAALILMSTIVAAQAQETTINIPNAAVFRASVKTLLRSKNVSPETIANVLDETGSCQLKINEQTLVGTMDCDPSASGFQLHANFDGIKFTARAHTGTKKGQCTPISEMEPTESGSMFQFTCGKTTYNFRSEYSLNVAI